MAKYTLMWAEEDHNYFDLEPALLNFGIKAEKKFGYGIKDAVMFGKGFHAEFYLSNEEIRRNHIEGYKFLMNKKKFEFLLNEIKKASSELYERVEVLSNMNLKVLNDDELFDLYDFYGFKLGNLFVCYSMTQPHKVTKLEDKLINFLKKNTKDVQSAVSILTTPNTKFVFTKTGGALFDSFSESVQKESAKINMSLINKNLCVEKKQSQIKRNNLIKKLNLSLKTIHITEVLRILLEERLRMRFVWMKALYYNELFLIEIKRRFNVSKKNLRMYDAFELEDLIRKNRILSIRKLKGREAGFVKILNNGDIETFEGEKAVRFLDEIREKPKNVDQIVGSVASKGYAVGKVVLFSYRRAGDHSKKIKNMDFGDIVVTEMTRPNIISACEKAGAIITDEGGVLSHAAIISREFQVPCVIGTKMATLILKDGDYVEVDAKKGIVKKITQEEYQSRKTIKKVKKIFKKAPLMRFNKLKKGNVLWFKELNKKDIPTVGGKGASLGELYKFVNVPNGFCISVVVYDHFLKKNKLDKKIKEILSGLDISNSTLLKRKSQEIRKLILSKKLSKQIKDEIISNYRKLSINKVAVRSSATAEDLPTASFAGQQDTYLNVGNEKELIKAVENCWASLFTQRAIYYREKNNFIHSDVLISVVIQEMIQPKFAGVMFTKDPIDKRDILIEIVKGLGEKLVSGEVTPNSYLLGGNDFKIVKKKEEFKFNLELLQEIAQIGKNIEKHYGSAQDIEFAIDKKGDVFILQSRAITTL
jgi:phosphohistidine swiveling domain-containing protein